MSADREQTQSTITLRYPVRTLDGQEILPAGVELTEDVMAGVAARGLKTRLETCPLMEYGSVREDLKLFIRVPPYNKFFSSISNMKALFENLSKTFMPMPILDTLKYFKHRDFYTYQHILVVFAISTAIARDLLGDSGAVSDIAIIGPTHNIGKICVPVKILKKHTPLTAEEKDIIDHHTAAGYVLLSHYLGDHESLAAIAARDHHEWRDGTGGPRGIKQSNQLIEIISVSDIYDALISPRSYRPVSFDNRSAIEILTDMASSGRIKWELLRSLISRNRRPYVPDSEARISKEKRGSSPPGNVYDTIDKN